MLESLKNERLQLFWLLFHVALGFACLYSKWALIGWFYLVLISFIVSLFTRRGQQTHNIIYLLAYSLGIEVLARGLGCSPWIPSEMGKYFGIVLFTFGLAMGGPIRRLSLYGVLMLFLSLPALVATDVITRKAVVFNYFGPLALFLGVIFCSRQIMTFTDLRRLIRMMVYSVFLLAFYTIFRSAQFEKIEYGLTANFESSGGSITNQVATLFGTAICLMLIIYLSRQRLFKWKWLDIGILMLFLFRGLLTFSRGGIVSAIIAIVAIALFPLAKKEWQDNEINLRRIRPGTLLMALLFVATSFVVINLYTGNYLLYRYQGRTERSLQTGFVRQGNIDQLTTGRFTIFKSDINMFMAYPVLGVGLGQSMKQRHKFDGPAGHAAHLEISRLMAEHGLPGLMLVVLIYIVPFFIILQEPNNYRRSVMLAFIIMALTATFHSAMRTMATPLLFSFAFINYVPTNYNWQLALRSGGRKWKQQARKLQMASRRLQGQKEVLA